MNSHFEIQSNQLCHDIPTEVQALSSSVTGWNVVTGNSKLGTNRVPKFHTSNPKIWISATLSSGTIDPKKRSYVQFIIL